MREKYWSNTPPQRRHGQRRRLQADQHPAGAEHARHLAQRRRDSSACCAARSRRSPHRTMASGNGKAMASPSTHVMRCPIGAGASLRRASASIARREIEPDDVAHPAHRAGRWPDPRSRWRCRARAPRRVDGHAAPRARPVAARRRRARRSSPGSSGRSAARCGRTSRARRRWD